MKNLKNIPFIRTIMNIHLSKIYFLLIFILAFVITACSFNDSNVYKPKREWHFIVKDSRSSIIDTIILKTYDESWKFTQRKIQYTYNSKMDSAGNIHKLTEITGVIDRKSNFFSRIFLEPEIWLHPPRNNNLRVTELLPFPWVKLPVFAGQTIDWELTPKKGWEDFEGKTITGKILVKNKIFYDNPVVNDSCWLVVGRGNSEIGRFNSTYYFNDSLGFTYFYYDFNEYHIEISLSFINFNK